MVEFDIMKYIIKSEIKKIQVARIENFDAVTMKASVVLLNQIKMGKEYKECPPIYDVPVMALKFGSFTITPNYEKGDVVLCAVHDCALDHLLSSNQSTSEFNKRHHEIEDLIVIGGLTTESEFNLPTEGFTIMDTNSKNVIQMNKAGQVYIGNSLNDLTSLNTWIKAVGTALNTLGQPVTNPLCMK